ncbi:hypothetical protein K438DRAFT_1996125 [Mycena galopus ATCC 62051]|nr:hypothetical protein K438DRAFT_1996125 [Mycena galopus ATCC 62051]
MTSTETPEFLAARLCAVQRSLDMIRAKPPLNVLAPTKANGHGTTHAPAASSVNIAARREEYARIRGAPDPPSPYATPGWGEGDWDDGNERQWTQITDPAWQDSGYWMTPEMDEISPIIPLRQLHLL